MAVIVGAIMVGVVVQHSGTDDVQNFAIEKTRISSQLEQIVETTFPEHTLETVSKDSELESTPEIIVIESNSFGKAFAEARENLGHNHIFMWNGQAYSTRLADEPESVDNEMQVDSIISKSALAEIISSEETSFPDGPDIVGTE